MLPVARRSIPDVLWQLVSVEGNALVIHPSGVPSGMLIKGIPSFTIQEAGLICTDAEEVLGDIRLIMSADTPASFTLTLPSLDDHVRWPNGAFLSGGDFAWVDPTVAPPIAAALGFLTSIPENIVMYANEPMSSGNLQGGSSYAWNVVCNALSNASVCTVDNGAFSWNIPAGEAWTFERIAGTWTRTV